MRPLFQLPIWLHNQFKLANFNNGFTRGNSDDTTESLQMVVVTVKCYASGKKNRFCCSVRFTKVAPLLQVVKELWVIIIITQGFCWTVLEDINPPFQPGTGRPANPGGGCRSVPRPTHVEVIADPVSGTIIQNGIIIHEDREVTVITLPISRGRKF